MSLLRELESSGNESAEQQLRSESHATNSKRAQPPTNSAILSASLLNAARVERRRTVASTVSSSLKLPSSRIPRVASSPGDMARHHGAAGKLKRPSVLRDEPRQSTACRRNVYDLGPESPEKAAETSPWKLSETVNHNPLKRVRKGKKASAQEDHSDAVFSFFPRSEGSPMHAADEELPFVTEPSPLLPSSPPRIFKGNSVPNPEPLTRKSGRLAGDVAEISKVDFARKPEAQSHRQTRSKRKADDGQIPAERSSKSPRQEGPPTSGQKPASTATSEGRGTRARAKLTNAKVLIPAKKVTKPTAPSRARTKAQEQGPLPEKRGRGRPAKTSTTTAGRHAVNHEPAMSNADGKVTRTPKTSELKSNEVGLPVRSSLERATRIRAIVATKRSATSADERSEAAVVPEVEEEAQDAYRDVSNNREAHTDIDQVFKFLDSETRVGTCQTEDATKIIRACRAARHHTLQPQWTIQEVSDASKNIRVLLRSYGVDQGAKQRKALKTDVYAYLFRGLIEYFETLHGWLEGVCGDISRSLVAMRILFQFVRDILSLKDTIASWKVSLPARHKGDRLIKDVDTELIIPLRSVAAAYRAEYSQLEAADNARRAHKASRQKKGDSEEEQERRADRDAIRQKKWTYWQDLHVWRQRAEPNPSRRRRLFIDKTLFENLFEEIDERDANGFKFERLPVFKQRVSPARRSSPSRDINWTDEQMEALIDGLTDFADRPDVLRNIFETHCRPGGALREFTVPQITAQATSIRYDLLQSYQREGWEVDDWIKRIPVLP